VYGVVAGEVCGILGLFIYLLKNKNIFSHNMRVQEETTRFSYRGSIWLA